MNSFTTRQLEPGDMEQLLEVATLRQVIMRHKIPGDYQMILRGLFTKYLDPLNRMFLSWGTFDQETGKLMSASMISLWPNFPYFSWNFVFARPSELNLTKNGPMFLAIKATLMYAYQQKLYRFYFARNEDGNNEPVIFKMHKTLPELNNWHLVIEDVVEPNATSRFPYVNNMLGNRTWPHRTIVYSYTLNQALRDTAKIFQDTDEAKNG